MQWAQKNDYIVFTHDLDFGAILFATQALAPSVIQIRHPDVRPSYMDTSVIRALQSLEKNSRESGFIMTIEPQKNRVTLLPLGK